MAKARPERPERESRRESREEPEAPAARGRRAAEEDVGRGSRGARSSGGGGGLGLAGKVALATGITALVVLAGAVVPSMGGPKEPDDGPLNALGYAAVNAMSGVEASQWLGGGSGSDGAYKQLKRNVERLFGDEGKAWIAKQEDTFRKVDPDAEAEEREEQAKRAKRFDEAVTALEKGGGGDADTKAAASLLKRMSVQGGDAPAVASAWVREGTAGAPGRFVVGTHAEGAVTLGGEGGGDGTRYWRDGTFGDWPVRVFYKQTAGGPPPATIYVAVTKPEVEAKSNTLGLVLLLLGPVLVGAIGYAAASGIGSQLRGLAREIDKLGSSGDPHRVLRVSGAEAGAVARAVERMMSNVELRQQSGGQDLEQIADREAKLASEIHEGLINKHPPRLSGYEVEHLFKPGFEVGGDHFEYFRIDDDHLGVILIDTNVRGIPAALVMSATRAYVRAAAPGNLSPAAVLKQVNKHLAGELPPGRHVTAVYVVIDTAQGKATLASAGHPAVLVFRQATGKLAKVNPAGIAMGLDVGPVFDRELEEGDVPILPGDRLVLYTDGALKITNETGEEFGEQRFYGAVAREAPKNSQAFVNFVGSAIDQFHLTTPQNDDVTISTVKRLR
jgi:serine phosphatase RsbU (regulator of sigma subunit)